MAFTDVFGGELIFPSQLSYLSLTTAVDVTLQWPTEQQITGSNVVADFLDINATAGSLNIDMPSALVTGEGNKATINNVGANTFTVRDSTGGTIQSIAPGEVWIIVLRDNTTAAGLWRTFQMGASVSVASASALAGAGIKAIGVLLNQKIDSDVEAATLFTVVDGDRAKCLIYTAGAGTANLTAAGTLGNDWFVMIRNSGSGTLNILPPAGTIDGSSSINLSTNDSCFIFTDGTNFFTVGLSSGSTIAFDFVSIPVPGSGDFVLSGANLNRISYRFTGALTGNRRIVVPSTTQQYWVDNQTTGAFTLEIDTSAGAGQVISQGESAIVYCDATDVINAVSSTSVTFPITIGQGGTGATNASAARTNLGAAASALVLTAGDGIVGGGDLTANRTFDFNLASITIGVPDLAADFFVFEDVSAANVNRKALLSTIGGITIQEEGTPLATLANTLDFVGAAVVASGAGATKTITISGFPMPVSTGASNILRGDGSGGWVEETDLTISSTGVLATTGNIQLSNSNLVITDGVDSIAFSATGGVLSTTETGGFTTFEIGTSVFRLTGNSMYQSEVANSLSDVAGEGQWWVRSDTPNIPMFTQDDGNDVILYESGSFTGTLTGGTTSPTENIIFQRHGNMVILYINGGGLSYTSNANTVTITGLPASLRPSGAAAGIMSGVGIGAFANCPVRCQFSNSDTITLAVANATPDGHVRMLSTNFPSSGSFFVNNGATVTYWIEE